MKNITELCEESRKRYANYKHRNELIRLLMDNGIDVDDADVIVDAIIDIVQDE